MNERHENALSQTYLHHTYWQRARAHEMIVRYTLCIQSSSIAIARRNTRTRMNDHGALIAGTTHLLLLAAIEIRIKRFACIGNFPKTAAL